MTRRLPLCLAGVLGWLGCGSAKDSGGGPTAVAPAPGLRGLLERIDDLPPAQVAADLAGLNDEERLTLSSYAALGSAVYRIACEAEPGLTAVVGGVTTNCPTLAQEYAQAVQLIGQVAVAQNAATERAQVLNRYRCRAGEIDAATCRASMGASRAGAAAVDDTNRRIGENIGNKCRVGVDPGCVP